MNIPIKEGLFYLPQSKDEQPHLIGSRCGICGYTCFPTKQVCVKCLRDDSMEEIKLGPYGKLDTYAVLHVAPTGFTAPYVQGYIILEGGPKIFSLITGCAIRDDSLQLGQRMELVIEKIKEDAGGNDVIGWKFKPAEEKSSS